MRKYKYQNGAAFIVVMFVLLLVTIIGAVAIKQSLTGLNIATNSQIQVLLQQNSDAAFFAIERDNKDNTILQRNLSSLGRTHLLCMQTTHFSLLHYLDNEESVRLRRFLLFHLTIQRRENPLLMNARVERTD